MKLIVEQISCHQLPMSLLLEADPSEDRIRSYLSKSACFAAKIEQNIVAACLLLPLSNVEFELMNISVLPSHQAKGIGSKLLRHVIRTAEQMGATKLTVGTGTFGYQLSFYQRAGFRVRAVERDFFLTHYPEPIYEHGIQHKDMLRLEIEFPR